MFADIVCWSADGFTTADCTLSSEGLHYSVWFGPLGVESLVFSNWALPEDDTYFYLAQVDGRLVITAN